MGISARDTLTPLTRPAKESPPRAVYDIECSAREKGEGLNSDFLGAGVFDGVRYSLHRSASNLNKALFGDRLAGHHIYAHNGSRYDIKFLLPFIAKEQKAQIIRAGSRIWVSTEDRTLADSMALLPVSLKDAAKALGCKTQKGEMDYENIENLPWQEYLESDCKATFESLDALEKRVVQLGGQLKRTLASTALDLFRRKYLDGPIYRERATEQHERAALYGGRTEVFKTRAENVQSFDISSSYSYAALSPAPVKFLGEEMRILDDFDDTDIVEAEVVVPKMYYPPLPYRHDGKLLFPCGHWSAWFVGLELHNAKRYGCTVQVLRRLRYLSKETFSDYVHSLYAEKMAGNPAAKWLLNVLFGRFALRLNREKIVIAPDKIKTGYRELNRENEIFGIPDKSHGFAFPAITAVINARARVRLHEALMRSEGKAVYCDTDGIKLENPNKSQCPDDSIKGVGEWKYEGTAKKFVCKAPKTYRLDNKIWTKGICLNRGNNEEKDLSFAIAAWISGYSTQYKLPGLIEQLKGDLPAKTKWNIKKIGIDLSKRIFDNDGNSTPLKIGE